MIGQLFIALPPALMHAVAGLALLGRLTASLQRALTDEKQREATTSPFLYSFRLVAAGH